MLSLPLQSSPTGCQTHQLQLRLMPLTMRLQPYSLLQHLLASYTQLLSIPARFTNRNATMTFTTKSYSRYLKLSPNGNIISRAPVHPLTSSLITETFSIFLRPRSSRVVRQDGPNTFLGSTSLFASVPGSSEPNPMHWLDDGTSILKRGIVTMPLPTHRTFARSLLPSNWHRPFELLPYPSQSYADLLSWILKGSIPTSSLNYETTQYLRNT